MPSSRSAPSSASGSTPALRALLALLLLALPTARAFYMPPEFDAKAVPAYPIANATGSSAGDTPLNGTISNGAPGVSGGVFDLRNHTAIPQMQMQTQTQAQPGPGARETSAMIAPGMTAVQTHTPPGAGSVGPRDVWSPRITAPDEETVWKVGETVTVSWDTSGRPTHVTNPEGKLVLGWLDDGEGSNEHLDIEHPLADGFDLSDGSIEVEVPDVDPSNHYILVLFGDSGNRSPPFTIVN